MLLNIVVNIDSVNDGVAFRDWPVYVDVSIPREG